MKANLNVIMIIILVLCELSSALKLTESKSRSNLKLNSHNCPQDYERTCTGIKTQFVCCKNADSLCMVDPKTWLNPTNQQTGYCSLG